ncbi:hypothetical protein PTSG_03357 [Salpingoeca rosetta]|uniref:Uncharacterized protein n=1 Tax=Salpingoeca rosetta (strain ATCC 50818 / BSB-021) TaxID=946362 RepID=F2U4Y1_SALR5|nr:uncharacterized protein PTSG_03357 [Salpingoeca rosetta]EGD82697.1 hypothetical protein PTSG_03357 [Salpingoeca rosetta]|eukprot:XP_004995933.1 hypothetical protein PTSG_03357 [Salpingoeca rosetta]
MSTGSGHHQYYGKPDQSLRGITRRLVRSPLFIKYAWAGIFIVGFGLHTAARLSLDKEKAAYFKEQREEQRRLQRVLDDGGMSDNAVDKRSGPARPASPVFERQSRKKQVRSAKQARKHARRHARPRAKSTASTKAPQPPAAAAPADAPAAVSTMAPISTPISAATSEEQHEQHEQARATTQQRAVAAGTNGVQKPYAHRVASTPPRRRSSLHRKEEDVVASIGDGFKQAKRTTTAPLVSGRGRQRRHHSRGRQGGQASHMRMLSITGGKDAPSVATTFSSPSSRPDTSPALGRARLSKSSSSSGPRDDVAAFVEGTGTNGSGQKVASAVRKDRQQAQHGADTEGQESKGKAVLVVDGINPGRADGARPHDDGDGDADDDDEDDDDDEELPCVFMGSPQQQQQESLRGATQSPPGPGDGHQSTCAAAATTTKAADTQEEDDTETQGPSLQEREDGRSINGIGGQDGEHGVANAGSTRGDGKNSGSNGTSGCCGVEDTHSGNVTVQDGVIVEEGGEDAGETAVEMNGRVRRRRRTRRVKRSVSAGSTPARLNPVERDNDGGLSSSLGAEVKQRKARVVNEAEKENTAQVDMLEADDDVLVAAWNAETLAVWRVDVRHSSRRHADGMDAIALVFHRQFTQVERVCQVLLVSHQTLFLQHAQDAPRAVELSTGSDREVALPNMTLRQSQSFDEDSQAILHQRVHYGRVCTVHNDVMTGRLGGVLFTWSDGQGAAVASVSLQDRRSLDPCSALHVARAGVGLRNGDLILAVCDDSVFVWRASDGSGLGRLDTHMSQLLLPVDMLAVRTPPRLIHARVSIACAEAQQELALQADSENDGADGDGDGELASKRARRQEQLPCLELRLMWAFGVGVEEGTAFIKHSTRTAPVHHQQPHRQQQGRLVQPIVSTSFAYERENRRWTRVRACPTTAITFSGSGDDSRQDNAADMVASFVHQDDIVAFFKDGRVVMTCIENEQDVYEGQIQGTTGNV